MELTSDKIERLQKAAELIADVQIDLLREQEKANIPRNEETWRDLYWLRIKLGGFIHCGFIAYRG